MKRFILLVLLLVNVVSMFAATEEDIVLKKEEKMEEEPRSLTYIPTATHSERVSYLYTQALLDDWQLIVTDTTGKEVATAIVTLLPNQRYALSLYKEIPVGQYKLTVKGEGKVYSGYFRITR